MSRANNPAVIPIPGHSEPIPDLKDDIDVSNARLDAEAEAVFVGSVDNDGPVVRDHFFIRSSKCLSSTNAILVPLR